MKQLCPEQNAVIERQYGYQAFAEHELYIQEILQDTQALSLALLRMKLHPEYIPLRNGGAERMPMPTLGYNQFWCQRREVEAMDMVEEAFVRHAVE